MSIEGDCRTDPATPGLVNTPASFSKQFKERRKISFAHCVSLILFMFLQEKYCVQWSNLLAMNKRIRPYCSLVKRTIISSGFTHLVNCENWPDLLIYSPAENNESLVSSEQGKESSWTYNRAAKIVEHFKFWCNHFRQLFISSVKLYHLKIRSIKTFY